MENENNNKQQHLNSSLVNHQDNDILNLKDTQLDKNASYSANKKVLFWVIPIIIGSIVGLIMFWYWILVIGIM